MIARFALGLGFAAVGIGTAALATPAVSPAPLLVVARVQGTIDPATSDFLATSIHRAEAEGAEALVVELDTPGGLISSVRKMAQAVDASRVPVIVYVAPAGAAATSAGALLAFSAHLAAMAPGTNLGAAHPVGSQGEDIKGAMGEKTLNDTVAFARSLAALRGRNAALAEAVVAKSRSFTAEEAKTQGLVNFVAPSRAELYRLLEGVRVGIGPGGKELRTLHLQGAREEELGLSLGQSLLHALANPNVASILMTLGLFLLYVEASHPGTLIPGVLGGISVLIAFMSFELLPIRAGGLALLCVGGVLMILEPFVTAHGAAAAGGILAFVLGLLWVIDPSLSDLHIRTEIWAGAALGLGSLVLLIAFAAARTRALTFRTRETMGGGSIAGLAGYLGRVESIQPDGRGGTATFRGERWEFEAGDAVQIGDPVEAVEISGVHVRVKRSTRSS